MNEKHAVADTIVLHTDKIHYTEIERNLIRCSYWSARQK